MLLDHPTPDFAEFQRVLKGEQAPRRVHLADLLLDEEILKAIVERHLDQPWAPWAGSQRWIPPSYGQMAPYFRQLVTIFYRLGYDYVPLTRLWRNHPEVRRRRTGDTADLSRGERLWVDEKQGLIASWQEFEEFPWDEVVADASGIRIAAGCLPPGMKITVMASLFEHVMENLLGYEGLFFMLHDEPRLVDEVFARWGQKVYDFYASVVGMEQVGAIFHGDDLGFKTSTLLSRCDLQRLLFPWLKRYAALAHANGKMFWMHSCGDIYSGGVIEDLIEDVRVDALHSFEDVIMPVTTFKARYGKRMAALGGVDMDKLSRLDEAALRVYLRDILNRCMPGGRFALGAGNSVANYIPLANYAVMLDESRRWQG